MSDEIKFLRETLLEKDTALKSQASKILNLKRRIEDLELIINKYKSVSMNEVFIPDSESVIDFDKDQAAFDL